MRAILALVVIALLMGLAGWLTIGHSPGKTSINFETNEIQHDTQNAVENAKSVIKTGVDSVSYDHGDVGQKTAITPEHNRAAPVKIDEEPVTATPAETPARAPTSRSK